MWLRPAWWPRLGTVGLLSATTRPCAGGLLPALADGSLPQPATFAVAVGVGLVGPARRPARIARPRSGRAAAKPRIQQWEAA
eukprot:11226048-Alexandrium_andersonii.AAC.1